MKDKDLIILEKQIFNELKDSKDNYNYMTKKYEGNNVNFKRLHRKILNYQYKVYGCSLRELEERRKRK